jgi:hypothetical protein
MAWHARGQGFKSPQLHPRSEAQIGPSRLQIPRLGQQIGSNPCCLGGSGRPARRQRRPASPPGNGHIRPPAATLTLQRSTGSVGARQIDSSRDSGLILKTKIARVPTGSAAREPSLAGQARFSSLVAAPGHGSLSRKCREGRRRLGLGGQPAWMGSRVTLWPSRSSWWTSCCW